MPVSDQDRAATRVWRVARVIRPVVGKVWALQMGGWSWQNQWSGKSPRRTFVVKYEELFKVKEAAILELTKRTARTHHPEPPP